MFGIRISTKFKIAILLEIAIFACILYGGYSNISDESQKNNKCWINYRIISHCSFDYVVGLFQS